MTTAPAPEERETSRHGRRISSLDGLRGLAAFVVVLHHIVLAGSPSLIYGYAPLTYISAPARWSAKWWIADTPLHIFWAGPEMVLVFFVLSGYVLALPAITRGRQWFDASYYPRRVLRLYLPVLGALVLAWIIHTLFVPLPVLGATFWLNAHAVPLHISDGLKDLTLLKQGDTQTYTTVLWSLQWEVEFSLGLPLALALVLVTRDRPWLALGFAAGCLALIALGAHSVDNLWATLHFLAIFELGSLLAMHVDSLPDLSRSTGWHAIGMLIVTVGLLTTTYWTQSREAISPGVESGSGLLVLCDVLGACAAVWLAARQPALQRALSRAPVNWLGTRSYTLYLVHEPIVVATAFELDGRPHVLLLAVIAIPPSLVVTELFWQFVERPSILAARWAGRATLALLGPAEPATEQLSAPGRPSSRRAGQRGRGA